MLKGELYKCIKSWKARVIMLIAIIFSLLHTFDAIFYTGTSDIKMNPFHPAYASFLNGISAKGLYRTYFKWIMPALFMLAYCNRSSTEKKTNTDIIYCTHIGRKKYFWEKIKAAGIVACSINLIPNLISITLTIIFLHGKHGFEDVEMWSASETDPFVYWCVHNPYAAYVLFLLSNLIVTTLLGMMCQSIVFIVEDSRLSILVAIAIWMGIYFGNEYFFLTRIMQPFSANNTLQAFILKYVRYIPMVVAWVAVAYYKVVKKSDRI